MSDDTQEMTPHEIAEEKEQVHHLYRGEKYSTEYLGRRHFGAWPGTKIGSVLQDFYKRPGVIVARYEDNFYYDPEMRIYAEDEGKIVNHFIYTKFRYKDAYAWCLISRLQA